MEKKLVTCRDRGEERRNRINRGPLVLQDGEAEGAVGIHVGMEDSGDKPNHRGLLGEIDGKCHAQFERTSFPR